MMLSYRALALGYLLLVSATPNAFGQKLTEIYSFQGGNDGRLPIDGLAAGNGLLYGSTVEDGPKAQGCGKNCGTIFSVSPLTGTEKIIAGGTGPVHGINSGLLFDKGLLYGTVGGNNAYRNGLVFSVDPDAGFINVIYHFKSSADGAQPAGPLIARGKFLYGTTIKGGSGNNGTVFSLDPVTGVKKTLYNFLDKADGKCPVSPLAYDNGTLYGTASCLITAATQTIFAIDVASGNETTLYTFPYNGQIPQNPLNGLILSNGTLYGTTEFGQGGNGSVFSFDLASNTETDLYEFKGQPDGQTPSGPLVFKSGTLYGETLQGGSKANGAVFQVNAMTGAESIVASFGGDTAGSSYGGLTFFKGKLYGTNEYGGAMTDGGVYAVKP